MEGLNYYPEVVSKELTEKIIIFLDSREWSTELSRRVQQFGYSYNYKRKNSTSSQPIVGPLLVLVELIKIYLPNFSPNQCIVNEYFRDQGIAAHTDNKNFGDMVVGFSLCEETIMNFTHPSENPFSIVLEPGSLLIMSGEIRKDWKHEIPKRVTYMKEGKKIIKPLEYRRISVTFRRVE